MFQCSCGPCSQSWQMAADFLNGLHQNLWHSFSLRRLSGIYINIGGSWMNVYLLIFGLDKQLAVLFPGYSTWCCGFPGPWCILFPPWRFLLVLFKRSRLWALSSFSRSRLALKSVVQQPCLSVNRHSVVCITSDLPDLLSLEWNFHPGFDSLAIKPRFERQEFVSVISYPAQAHACKFTNYTFIFTGVSILEFPQVPFSGPCSIFCSVGDRKIFEP